MGFSKGNDVVRRRRGPDRRDRIIDPNFEEDDRPLELSRRRLADPDQEPDHDARPGSDHGRRLPQQSVSLVSLRRSGRRPLFALAPEIYPRTRTSNAVALNATLLPAVSRGGVRRLSLLHGHLGHRRQHVRARLHASDRREWVFEASYRFYTQEHADFYSDLFERRDQQNFLARDKELSTFNSQSLRHRRDL